MELNELVRKIVQEVLEKHNNAAPKTLCGHVSHENNAAPLIVVLAERDDQLASKVLKHLAEDAVLRFFGEPAGTRNIALTPTSTLNVMSSGAADGTSGLAFSIDSNIAMSLPQCRYILPFLSCNDMADLAQGKASGIFMSEVLRLLLAGKEVEVMEFEYRSYSETAPVALYGLYQSYEKTLAAYGLKECGRKQPDAVRFREDLLTAADVNKARENGALTLMIPLSAKVTPLAAEAARNLNINILKGL